MDLNALQTFVAVVRADGFAVAARQTNAPRSSVSLRIRNLEKALGVRLFKRSTRAFSLTAEGQELYNRAADALGVLTGAVESLSRAGQSYTGDIRMTLPADFPADVVAAAIGEFRAAHPAVRFEILMTNEVLDLVADNVDIALRVGAANPQEALVRGALDLEFGLYATADYLRVSGPLNDLTSIMTLIGPQLPALRKLLDTLLQDGHVLPPLTIAADSFLLVRELVLQHQGVGILPMPMAQDAIGAGNVVPVLPGLFTRRLRLHLTYPSRADLNPKITAFATTLIRHFGARTSQATGPDWPES